jgi:hypothetical protein
MALKRFQRDPSRTVGYVSHDSLVRIDRRVKDITRRQAASLRARRAAEHLEAATPSRDVI